MLISEIYRSLQGEGLWSGTDSVFIRTSGCNLRCWFCDTPYTSWQPTGRSMSNQEILEHIELRRHDSLPSFAPHAPAPRAIAGAAEADEVAGQMPAHVVITGGEPMLWPDLADLTERLRAAGYQITIETAGTLDREVACDLISISPKLSSSAPTDPSAAAWRVRHERTRWQPDVIQRLIGRHPYQLKFVVDRPEDLGEINRCLAAIGPVDRQRVLLMPQGVELAELEDKAGWLEPLAAQWGFQYCPRLHLQWFGHRRGV